MSAADRASAQFSTASACSQSVATAFHEEMGMDFETVHRLSTGFGGGMGTRQLTCGAVSGGVFALSAVFGSSAPEEADSKARTKALVDRFFAAVHERLGATDCAALLGCGLEEAGEKGLFDSVCSGIVRTCAEEVERIIAGEHSTGEGS